MKKNVTQICSKLQQTQFKLRKYVLNIYLLYGVKDKILSKRELISN